MIEQSLILGSLWYALCRIGAAIRQTGAYRAFDRLCRRIGAQARGSVLVAWFCTPRWSDEPVAPGRLRRALGALYRRLGLDRLMEGSIFLQCFIWCALPAALSPLLPTIALLALALVGIGSTALALLHRSERQLQPSRVNALTLIYAAVYLLGALTSVTPGESLYVGCISAAFIVFSAALYRAVDSRRQLDLLVTALILAALAVSCYGIVQYVFRLGYQSKAWVDSGMFGATFRVSSTLQNPNMLGEYLVLTIPLAVGRLFSSRGEGRRVFYLVCCGVMGVCMVLTFSRGAWLGLLFAAAVFVLLALPRLLWLAPLALVGLYFVLPDAVVARFTSIGNLGDSSTSYRVYILLGTIAMLLDGYWLTGIGPGDAAFNTIYPIYSYAAVTAPHSHNLFLQIVCDAGIAALAVFVWLILRWLRALCRAMYRETQRENRVLQASFTAGMLGFLLQGMTDYSFYNYRVMFLFWVYLAAGALAARRGALSEGGLLS